jgi:deoxyribonuclease-4
VNEDLGAHLSTAGGLATCFERAREEGARCAQIFVKNQRRWAARPLLEPEVRAFGAAWRASDVGAVVAHATYLINLAAEDAKIWANSALCLGQELGRAAALGLGGVVVHPGSSLGPREHAIARIALGIEQAFREAGEDERARLILENTAGAGGTVGLRFEELRAILDALPARLAARVDICIDTCHLHAAGYDLGSTAAYEATMRELDVALGARRVAAIHVNDSKGERGSRVDRHANIGEGTIGLACFAALLADPRFRGVPKILETPREGGGHLRDLATLRRLRAAGKSAPAARPRGPKKKPAHDKGDRA